MKVVVSMSKVYHASLHIRMVVSGTKQIVRIKLMMNFKAENEKLATRLRSLDSSDGKDAVLRAEASTSSKELEDMKAKVSAAELKNKRLVEAFQVNSEEKN